MSSVRIYKGFKPYLHQRAVLNEVCTEEAVGKGKVVCCKSSRQKGKSFTNANILLWYAINIKNSKNFYIAPTLKQGKELFKTIINAIIKSGIVKSSNATELTIKLINGSAINFKSAEQKDNLRGYTCKGILIIDEAAYIDDDVFDIIHPWVDVYNSNILMTSTPLLKSGFFFKYYCYGLEGTHRTVTVDWSDKQFEESIRQMLPLEKLEEYRSQLPTNVFKTEYLGEFIDDEGALFTGFKECEKPAKIQKTDRLYVGIDWSNQGQNDDTVLSVFNQNGEQVLLKYFNNLTPLKQIDVIFDELRKYQNQIVQIQPELNSIGTPYTDLLKERSQILARKIVGFDTTNRSKDKLVSEISVAFENGGISLLPDEKQRRQFSYYTATYNPKTKNVSYNAPQGLNDDIVVATMLAYDCYKKGIIKGHYCLG